MRSSRGSLLQRTGATLALLGLWPMLVSVQSVSTRSSFDNGDFEQGFAGWKLEPTTATFGTSSAFADASIAVRPDDDGTNNVAVLRIVSSAQAPFITGTSYARMSLKRSGLLTGNFLDFQTSAIFSTSFTGPADLEYRGEVVVRGTGRAAGLEASLVLLADSFTGAFPCPASLSGDGEIQFGRRSIDLAANGFRLGDRVEVEVSWEGMVTANVCEDGDISGDFVFDNFRFRN